MVPVIGELLRAALDVMFPLVQTDMVHNSPNHLFCERDRLVWLVWVDGPGQKAAHWIHCI